MKSNSVFMKKEQNYKIEYKSIKKTIPENSYTEPQKDKDDMIETRWRVLYIPLPNAKKMVEISRKRPNSEREYLNKNMKWIITNIDKFFDNFVVKEYYYYSNK